MARVYINASMSLDGFVARPDDSVGPLFDWYGNGDVAFNGGDPERVFHVSRASADYLGRTWPTFAGGVQGRRLFDLTDGWGGRPAVGDFEVVVTRRPHDEWSARYPDAPFHFAADVETGIALAKELAGDRDVSLTAGKLGGAAFAKGLVDGVAIDLVPVVLGEGIPFFGDHGGTERLLGDPEVVHGDRVTHLRYELR